MQSYVRIILSIACLGIVSTAAAAAPGYIVGGVYMTAEQAEETNQNFALLRSCPVEMNAYDVNERDGDCLGGQSGTISGN